jgi:hypothetical protein
MEDDRRRWEGREGRSAELEGVKFDDGDGEGRWFVEGR